MSSKKKNSKVFENVLITDIADEGKAVAKSEDGPVIFVQKAVPGDVVDIQVRKKRKKYYEGQVIKYHTYSELREDPFCNHFGVCGGCKWQYMKYEAQLKFKQNRVIASLTRIGNAPSENILNIIPSANTKYYRNKLEYTFSNKRWLTQQEIESGDDFNNRNSLGFHIPRMFDKVLDIEECFLQKEPSNSIRLAVKKYALENDLEFYDIREKHGLLRNLIIRTSSIGELMVIVCFFRNDEKKIKKLMDFLKKQFPEVTSLMYVVNEKANDTIHDQDIILFSGKDHIFEELENLRYKIGPKSFFQTNTEQGLNLYKITRDYAKLTGNETVYDLYTGTGTIANFTAQQAKKVIGVEFVPEAIEDAKVNSKINGISNTSFFAGDMRNILNEQFINEQGKPQVIILDPPRAGVHKDVIDALLYCNPERIVYVSCNPATQARDIALLSEKYSMVKAQPVDMFPHTDHVENVALLERI